MKKMMVLNQFKKASLAGSMAVVLMLSACDRNDKLRKLKNENQKLKDSIAASNTEQSESVQKANEEMEKLKQDIKDREAIISNLENDVTKLNENIKSLNTEKSSLEEKIKAIEKSNNISDSISESIAEQEESREALLSQMEFLKRENESLQNQKALLDAELASLTTAKIELEKRINELSAGVSGQQQTNGNNEAEIQQANQKLKEIEDKIQAAQTTLLAKNESIESMNKKEKAIIEQTAALVAVEERLKQLFEQIKGNQSQLAKYEKDVVIAATADQKGSFLVTVFSTNAKPELIKESRVKMQNLKETTHSKYIVHQELMPTEKNIEIRQNILHTADSVASYFGKQDSQIGRDLLSIGLRDSYLIDTQASQVFATKEALEKMFKDQNADVMVVVRPIEAIEVNTQVIAKAATVSLKNLERGDDTEEVQRINKFLHISEVINKSQSPIEIQGFEKIGKMDLDQYLVKALVGDDCAALDEKCISSLDSRFGGGFKDQVLTMLQDSTAQVKSDLLESSQETGLVNGVFENLKSSLGLKSRKPILLSLDLKFTVRAKPINLAADVVPVEVAMSEDGVSRTIKLPLAFVLGQSIKANYDDVK